MTNRSSELMPPPIVVGAFVLLMVAYHGIFGAYFPLPNGLMGHDYSGTLPGFMDGFLWFRNNGFLLRRGSRRHSAAARFLSPTRNRASTRSRNS